MASRNAGYSKRTLRRREILKWAGGASIASALGTAARVTASGTGMQVSATGPPVSGPGEVVRVHMPGMRSRFAPFPEAARMMVGQAVTTLTGKTDSRAAWSTFIRPDDRVGIKINLVGGRFSGTTREVVDAIIDALLDLGVRADRIMVFDQFSLNMKAARFSKEKLPEGIRVVCHKALGYDTRTTTVAGISVRLSNALLQNTAVVNVPVIKDHGVAGVTCAMKNMVYGVVASPEALHRNLHVALPHLYGMEAIRGRVRLTLADGSFCLFDGGPKHNPAGHAVHDSIYATTDPVAMDRIALDVIDGFRRENRLRTLTESGRPAKYLELAADLGLGIADRSRIHLETVTLPRFSGSAA